MGRIPKPGVPRELVFYPLSLQSHMPGYPRQDQDCQSHTSVAPVSVAGHMDKFCFADFVPVEMITLPPLSSAGTSQVGWAPRAHADAAMKNGGQALPNPTTLFDDLPRQ